MAEDLQVVIGASIGGLIAGVHEATSAIESLRGPVDQLFRGFQVFAEVTGIAFVVEQLFEVAESMAKVGENAVNMGAVLGLTPERFQTISDAMGVVGLTGDALTRTFRTLSNATETAIANPISRQGDAFKEVELDAKKFAETLRTDPEKAIDILAQKFLEFGESGVSGPFGVFFGRSSGAIIKFLKEGEEGIAKLKELVKESGSPNNDVLTALDQLDDKFNLFSQSARNVKIAIVDFVNEPLQQLLTTLIGVNTEFIKFINSRKTFDEDWKKGEEWGDTLTRGQPGGTALLDRFGRQLGRPPPDTVREDDGSVTVRVPPAPTVAGHVAPELDTAVDKLIEGAKEAGYEIKKGSGLRSHDEQQALYDADVAAHGGTPSGRVGRPGRSMHEYGFAYDLRGADDRSLSGGAAEWARKHASEFGLNFPMSYEPWHVQLAGTGAEGTAGEEHKKHVAEINTREQKRAMDEEIKDIKNREKEELASLAVEEAKNHDDLDMRAQLARQKVTIEQKAHDDIEAARKKYDPDVAKTVDNSSAEAIRAQAGVINAERAAQNERDGIALKRLESERKIADDLEQTELKSVERRRQSGELTVSDSLTLELKIVDDHRLAVDKILADEKRLTEGRDKLHEQVVDKARELEQKMDNERRAIQEKAQAEEIKRGHDIDKEIAKTVSGGVVDLAWGKSTPGAAIASTAQDLEKRALDSVLTKALDASGIGSLLDKAWSSTVGSLFSKGVDAVTTAPAQALANATAMTPIVTAQTTALITGITVPIVGAITGSAAATAGTSALGTAASAGGGFFSFLKFLLPFEHGGIVPSAAGGWQVPNVGSGSIMAQLHSNEMVLPSGISSFIQNAAASGSGKGSGVSLNYSPTIHAHEAPNLKQTLSRHGGDMLNWMQSQFRSGALRVPA